MRRGRDNRGWTARRIRTLREARGEKLWEFAEHFRLHWRTVQRWENGENVPIGPATVILDLMEQQALRGKVIAI